MLGISRIFYNPEPISIFITIVSIYYYFFPDLISNPLCKSEGQISNFPIALQSDAAMTLG